MKTVFFKYVSQWFPRLSLKVAKWIVIGHRGLQYTSKPHAEECSITIGELLTEADKVAIELKMKGILHDPVATVQDVH